MNATEAKKIRVMYRREVQSEAREMAAIIGNAMKPKPKWVPMYLWLWAMGFFIKINKTGVKWKK